MSADEGATQIDHHTIALDTISGRVVYERDLATAQFETNPSGKPIQTGITRLRDYVILDRNGFDHILPLHNSHFQARPANVVTLVYGLDGDSWILIGAKNHDNDMWEVVPNIVARWFRGQAYVPQAVIIAGALSFTATIAIAHVSLWLAVPLAAAVGSGILLPMSRWVAPYYREQSRVRDYVQNVPRPTDEVLPAMSDDKPPIIYQQFNAPNYGYVTQNNIAAQSFPADRLRALLGAREEVQAVDALQEELASQTPRRSKVSSALETLRNVTDVYDVVRVMNDWWSSVDVQQWLATLHN